MKNFFFLSKSRLWDISHCELKYVECRVHTPINNLKEWKEGKNVLISLGYYLIVNPGQKEIQGRGHNDVFWQMVPSPNVGPKEWLLTDDGTRERVSVPVWVSPVSAPGGLDWGWGSMARRELTIQYTIDTT